MKGIVFTTDKKMYIKDFENPLYQTVGEVVGGYIEIVNPRGLKHPFCFICNEEGLLKGLPVNLIGCVWYGTLDHGHPIVGNIVVMKEDMTDDGPDIVGLTDDDIRQIKAIAMDYSSGNIQDLDKEEVMEDD